MLNKNKVAVGLSGGVDSAVTAYLLKKQGYEVIGLTMKLFDVYDIKGKIIEPKFIEDAKNVAETLNIQHYVVDYREIFKKGVLNEFIEEYINGRTPNPCVTCNRIIKYGKLLETAQNLGAYYIATGHYAKITYDKDLDRYRIFRGESDRKDQAYVLHSLSQEQLKHVILPLGKFKCKEEVREIANEIDLNVAKKSDSVGICFIPNGEYASYIKSFYPNVVKEGDFVDTSGNILGKHKGIVNYTIGQKRGLGVNFDKPKFVVDIDVKKNEVVLGKDEDTYSKGLIAKNPNFTLFDELKGDIRVEAKVCHWGLFLKATISKIDNNKIKVIFDKKERAIAPGQAVVFYKGNEIIGGATIESAIK